MGSKDSKSPINRKQHRAKSKVEAGSGTGVVGGLSRYKLVIVGDGACGKTSLLTVFKTGVFPTKHIPTIFETDVARLALDGQEIELTLWDTAGQETYDRLRPLSYPQTDVVLICFSIDRPDSLSNVEAQWAKEVHHFCKGVPIILVGNKSDLRTSTESSSDLDEQVHVTADQIRSVSNKIHAYASLECSAKLKDGVQMVFKTAARAAIAKKKSYVPGLRLCNIF